MGRLSALLKVLIARQVGLPQKQRQRELESFVEHNLLRDDLSFNKHK